MREINLRPTVFLGLGGTGLAVLLRLKKALVEKLGTIPPCFEFLAIDTTEPEELSLPVEESDGQNSVTLELGADRHIVQLANTQGYIEDPYVAAWWPERLPMLAIRAGANQLRANGRLAFFADYQEISSKIRGKVNKVIDIETTQEMMNISSNGLRFLRSDRSGIDVYIVSSLAGGTGSGMLLDTAFVVRSMIEEISNITGILVLPKVFNSQATSSLKANAYGALKEIEHFMKVESGSSEGINYGSAPVEVNNPPFDWMYLIDNVNGGNGGKNKNGIGDMKSLYELVSRGLFTLVASPIGAKKTNELENLRSGGAIRTVRGQSANYCSFGVARLRMPSRSSLGAYEAKKKMSAHSLAESLLGVGGDSEAVTSSISTGLLLRLGLDVLAEILARHAIQTDSGNVPILAPDFPRAPSRKSVVREVSGAYDEIVQKREAEIRRLSDIHAAKFLQMARLATSGWWDDIIQREGGFTTASNVITATMRLLEVKLVEIEDGIKRAGIELDKVSRERERRLGELKDSARLTFRTILRGSEEQIRNSLQNLLEVVKRENSLYFSAYGWRRAGELVKYIIDLLAERGRLAEVNIKYLQKLIGNFTAEPSAEQEVAERIESFDVMVGVQNTSKHLQLSTRDFLKALSSHDLTLSSLLELSESEVMSTINDFVNEQYGPFSVGSLGEALGSLESRDDGVLSRSIKWFSDLADPLWSYDKSKIPLAEVNGAISGLSYCEAAEEPREILSRYGDALSSFRQPVSFVNSSSYQSDDEAVLFKVEVGIPLFALDDIDLMKLSYDNLDNPSFAHINRDWVKFPELIPCKSLKSPHFYFSVASAPEPFGIIRLEGGNSYVLMPMAGYQEERKVLGVGRGEAFSTFRADMDIVANTKAFIDVILNQEERAKIDGTLRRHILMLREAAKGVASDYASQISREITTIREYLKYIGGPR